MWMAVGLAAARNNTLRAIGYKGRYNENYDDGWVAGYFLLVMLLLLICCLASSSCMGGYGISGCGDWLGPEKAACGPGLVGRPLTTACARCGALECRCRPCSAPS